VATIKTKSKGSITMAADEITPEPLMRTGGPLRLRRSRREAAGLIRNQLKIGQAIRNQRLGSLWDLDQARSEKQEWVQRTHELLAQLFSDESVAEQCNEWYGTILPEYAELEMFIEQFEQEMKTRLGKLQDVLKMLDNLPEPPSTIGVVHAAHLASSSSSVTTSPSQVESAQLPPSHLPPAAELKAILKSSESSQGAPTAAADAVMRSDQASDETADAGSQPEEDLTTLWQPPPAGSAAPIEDVAPAPTPAPAPIPAAPLHQAHQVHQPQQAQPMQANPTRHAHSSSSSSSTARPTRSNSGHSSSTSSSNSNGEANGAGGSFNAAPSAAASAPGKSQRAMLALVMHGQVDPARRDEVEKLLEKLGLAPVIVERVSAKTFAIDVASIDARGCAILLLGDSVLEAQDADADPQPPCDADSDGDLMFVLGCSVGRFGGRICVLQAANDAQRTAPTLERAGFSSLLVDGGEGWKLQLVRQLKATGLTVDLNRLV
jgi:hypothetical protein